MAEGRVQRRLAAILAADVVGYSRLMEADEELTRARLRSCSNAWLDLHIVDDTVHIGARVDDRHRLVEL